MLSRQPTGSAILTTIFLMFGILSISLIGLDIIMGGMAARRAQGASARAYYAAESGIERALMAFKLDKDGALFGSCVANAGYLQFCNTANDNCDIINTVNTPVKVDPSIVSCDGNKHTYHLNLEAANPTYWVHAQITGRIIELNSRGSYGNTSRELYVKFCLPNCPSGSTGLDDGCGGICK